MKPEPALQGSEKVNLIGMLARAVVGAIGDCEDFVESARAKRLRTVVGAVAVAAGWAAWVWLAVLALYLLIMPIAELPAGLVTGDFDSRSAVFAVLGLALAGPVALLLAWWSLVFIHRIAVDATTRRVPRAFSPLMSPALVLVVLATLWSWRGALHHEVWRVRHEIGNILDTAAQFTLIGP